MSNGRDDIRVAVGWLDHVKTRLLVQECGHEGATSLIRLWCYAAVNHFDGKLKSEKHVEAVADWRGQPGKFLAALKEIGWLEQDGITLHDWQIEQPWAANRGTRSDKARANAKKRWSTASIASSNAQEQYSPSPSPSPPAPTSCSASASPPTTTNGAMKCGITREQAELYDRLAREKAAKEAVERQSNASSRGSVVEKMAASIAKRKRGS